MKASFRPPEKSLENLHVRPGDKWYKLFLKRHPELSLRVSESISKGRAVVTEESIKAWFHGLHCYLEEMNCTDILDDPTRIFNGDETSFNLCPKTGKVLCPKKWKNVYEISMGNEKETLTVLIFVTAAGELVTPMIVYPYMRLPPAVAKSVPSDWIIGKSDSGWMQSQVFYEYMANGFNDWLTENNESFAPLLEETLNNSNMKTAIINGFLAAGIYPFEPDAVGYTKCVKNAIEKLHQQNEIAPIQSEELINSILILLNHVKLPLAAQGIDIEPVKKEIKNYYSGHKLNVADTFFETNELPINNDLPSANMNHPIVEQEEPFIMELNSEIYKNNTVINSQAEYVEMNGSVIQVPIIEVKENMRQEVCIDLEKDLHTEPNSDMEIIDISNLDFIDEIDIPNLNFIDEIDLLIQEEEDYNAKVETSNMAQITESSGADKSPLTCIPGCSKDPSYDSAFGTHLFYPSPINKKSNVRTKVKLPRAISSSTWRQHINAEQEKKRIWKK
uniref:DDE-1 domain-containing protein n=1 Tax=Trichogramma kaykai TaxID=54128 RepID=A0ABD2X2H0_9HYME